MSVDDLAAFLRARIDEQVAVASAWAGQGPWSLSGGGPWTDYEWAFTPAWVLAECEAKRRIIEDYARTSRQVDQGDVDYLPRTNVLIDVLHELAVVYRDHPDYRDEWRP